MVGSRFAALVNPRLCSTRTRFMVFELCFNAMSYFASLQRYRTHASTRQASLVGDADFLRGRSRWETV